MTRPTMRRVLVGGACLVVTTTMSGCSDNRATDVQQVASRFYDATSGHDGPGACALLAPPTRSAIEQSEEKPCADAILEAGLSSPSDVERVRVYGTMAQITWTSEVTFLTRYSQGWRVLAAGCAMPPAPERTADRYDCTVDGG